MKIYRNEFGTILALTLFAVFAAAPASAAQITVCPSSCDHTTLQDAVNNADVGDTIDVKASGSPYEGKTIADPATNVNGFIDVTIRGQGQSNTVLRPTSGASERVFRAKGGAVVRFEDITLGYGRSTASGGCLSVTSGSQVTLKRVVIEHCTADGAGGGAVVRNAGSSLTVETTTIRSNYSEQGGGGIRAQGNAYLSLAGATIDDNNTAGNGGLIDCLSNATVDMNPAFLSNGTALGQGNTLYVNDGCTVNFTSGTTVSGCVATPTGTLNDPNNNCF